MKKLFLATLTILLILIAGMGMAQTVKIGNITLDSTTAQRYFLDCYQHPDTVQSEFANMYYFTQADNDKKEARDNELSKISTGKATRTVYVPEHNDTSYDGAIWASGDWQYIKKHAKKIQITHEKAYSYIEFLGYLIPRKPSEIDFVKWNAKQQLSK